VWLGVYPAPVLRRMQPAAEQFVRIVETRAAMPPHRRGLADAHAFDLAIPSQLSAALVPDLI
jgi:hypothetical protein